MITNNLCENVGGQINEHFLRKYFHEVHPDYKVQIDQLPPIIAPELYLEIFKLNRRFPHRWKNNISNT